MQNRETAQKEPCQHCGRTDYRWTHEFRVSLSFSPEDKLEIRCDYCRPLRMDAYYFEFAETGVEAIDRILSAVAQAGKGYHHTESWGDEGLADMGEFHGGSYVAWIQNAANDAAKVLASPLSAPPQEPTGASPQAETLGDAVSALWRALCEGDGKHSEMLDRSIIATHLERYAAQKPALVSPVAIEMTRRINAAAERSSKAEADLTTLRAQVETLTAERQSLLRDVFTKAADIEALRASLAAVEGELVRFKAAFFELHATVTGECPSLLDPCRGGSDVLRTLCDAALTSPTQETTK